MAENSMTDTHTAPAIEGGELVKRARNLAMRRGFPDAELLNQLAAFIEQSSTLLADAERRARKDAIEEAAKIAAHKSQSAQIAADEWASVADGQDMQFVRIKNAEAHMAREIWSAIRALDAVGTNRADLKGGE